METRKFDIYHNRGVYLGGTLHNGCLSLLSEVYGPRDSEAHYTLDRKNTQKLLSIITLDELIEYGRRYLLIGLIDLFEKNQIMYSEYVI